MGLRRLVQVFFIFFLWGQEWWLLSSLNARLEPVSLCLQFLVIADCFKTSFILFTLLPTSIQSDQKALVLLPLAVARDSILLRSCSCVWTLILTQPLTSVFKKSNYLSLLVKPFLESSGEACLTFLRYLNYLGNKTFHTLLAMCAVISKGIPIPRGQAVMFL